MRLLAPESLHYPITITKLRRQVSDEVARTDVLFDYEYKSKVLEGSEDNKEGKYVERTWPSTFESYLEGSISAWLVREGSVVTRSGVALVEIEEPCKHEVQFGGMCAICGRDMTTVEYNTVTRDTARATVNTVHGHTALLVSQAEASRTDEEAKKRLLSSRKLSLVVDLDQTIIHATVDPTVPEWQKDPSNPNYEALKDVRAFQLVDDGPGARGCWYYIKLRPGLMQFLENVSKDYELHIYTMGTRAYAQSIAKIVDPERRIFADRILSRDESGSLTVKNLKRLFPVDTKMVAIIDDRGDVWHWSQNLIKVKPYDFFVGIGDINSSFLPKRPGVLENHAGNGSLAVADPKAETKEKAPEPAADPDVSAIQQLVTMSGGNDPGKLQEQATQQNEEIAAQMADRPLMQKQKILDETSDPESEQQQSEDSQERHNLLKDDDTELQSLERSLHDVHQEFFEQYDEVLERLDDRKSTDLMLLPDVSSIMARMKREVLTGVSLVFSGVVPLGTDMQSFDLAVWARSFGAAISDNISKRTTHVIASPHRRTAKVRRAARQPHRMKIVTQEWLLDSLSQWRRVDEQPYMIHGEAESDGGNPRLSFEANGDLMLSSTDDDSTPAGEEPDPPQLPEVKTDEDTTELRQHMPRLSRADSTSHVQSDEDWKHMNDELADFLGSDAEDASDSDGESVRSEQSSSQRKKPKRKAVDLESALTDTDSDSNTEGSRLQKRRKKAAARTSNLVEEVHTDKQENGADEGEDGDGDDDLEAELEAEMLRQAEEE